VGGGVAPNRFFSIHLTSAASEGLFQRAILESPPAAFIYKSAKQAAHYGTYFSKYANCSHGGLECLQKAPLAAILDADKKAAGAIPPLIEAGLTIDR
jgi:carboxylesterase type B